MNTGACPEEADDLQAVTVDLPEPVRMHVGDVEDPAVRRELHVLRHPNGAVRQLEDPGHALAGDVDLDHLAGELAAGDQVATVGGEVEVVDTDARDGQ